MQFTEPLFQQDAYLRKCAATVVEAGEGTVVLDRTVFYPLGGGQPGDTGVLRGGDGHEIRVVDTRKGEGGRILHVLAPDAAAPAIGAADRSLARLGTPLRAHAHAHVPAPARLGAALRRHGRPGPTKGDWTTGAVWLEPDLGSAVAGVKWPIKTDDRRDLVVERLDPSLGPLLSNPTRGQCLLPNIPVYGPFLGYWTLIYERFGVPADLGLSQAVLESGLNGTARSRANALGLCQWLRRNWQALDRLSPVTIEAYNQTTQAPYCAAYLSILATMYGSFIPALSEHHSGGVNVGRTLISGERLGASTPREQYFMGSQFARDLRAVDLKRYRDLYPTDGPRSFRYAEMS